MPDTHVFLGRQPILGREQQLLAYELLYRDGLIATGNRADVLDPTCATATVIANAFTELSTQEVLGPYRGFINVDTELLFSELIEALPPQLVVLEILESVAPTAEVVARCEQLRARGFSLAVDDIVNFDEAYRPLLLLADIIKVDILKMEDADLRTLVSQLAGLGKKLLAEKVESAERFALCQNLGFSLFQGYYFAKPTIIVGKKLNPAQQTLIRLLALVMEDAETCEIENAFKLEPGLTVNMLRLTNSVSNGLQTKITSLRHAITILGRRQLQRWLQLLIYTNPKDKTQSITPLLQLAASRGRLMELLADRIQPKNREFADQAFMVGIMSLMPTLLGIPMSEILAQLPVAQRVMLALQDRIGQHGLLLNLAEATEQTEANALDEALHCLPGISTDQLGDTLAQALFWANNLGREQNATALE